MSFCLTKNNLEEHCSYKQYITVVFKAKLHLLDFNASYPNMGIPQGKKNCFI